MENHEAYIREYQLADATALSDLYNITWNATYTKTLGRETVQEMLFDLQSSNMKGMMPGNGETTLVACANQSVIGSAIFAERGNVAYLWGMYVLPDWQHKGVGTRLLLAVNNQLTIARMIEVRTVDTSTAANAFYLKHGFKKIDEEETELATGKSTRTNVLTLDIQSTK